MLQSPLAIECLITVISSATVFIVKMSYLVYVGISLNLPAIAGILLKCGLLPTLSPILLLSTLMLSS